MRNQKKGSTHKFVILFAIFVICSFLTSCSGNFDESSKNIDGFINDNQKTVKERIETQIAVIELTASVTNTPGLTATETPVPTNSPTITLSPTPTIIPGTPTSTLPPEFFHGSYSYNLPLSNQTGLKYKGVETKLGCTAASIQMILDFWKAYNQNYKTLKAQTIIDINTAQGSFHSKTGLSITNVEDELTNLNYYLGVHRNSKKQDLIDALERYGPLPVLVKTEWIPTGANHLVVLVEYDPQNDTVTFNDPWYEWPVTWNWEAFDGIWNLNYSEDEDGYLVRTFFFIVPKTEIRPGNDLFIQNPNSF